MNIYVDSSWLLTAILKRSRIKFSPARIAAYSSILIMVECRRTLDRQLKRHLINDAQFAEANRLLTSYLQSFNLIDLESDIVMRAAEAFYLPLGSLDALHLATAMKLRNYLPADIGIYTLDHELADAARAHGFIIKGS